MPWAAHAGTGKRGFWVISPDTRHCIVGWREEEQLDQGRCNSCGLPSGKMPLWTTGSARPGPGRCTRLAHTVLGTATVCGHKPPCGWRELSQRLAGSGTPFSECRASRAALVAGLALLHGSSGKEARRGAVSPCVPTRASSAPDSGAKPHGQLTCEVDQAFQAGGQIALRALRVPQVQGLQSRHCRELPLHGKREREKQ